MLQPWSRSNWSESEGERVAEEVPADARADWEPSRHRPESWRTTETDGGAAATAGHQDWTAAQVQGHRSIWHTAFVMSVCTWLLHHIYTGCHDNSIRICIWCSTVLTECRNLGVPVAAPFIAFCCYPEQKISTSQIDTDKLSIFSIPFIVQFLWSE